MPTWLADSCTAVLRALLFTSEVDDAHVMAQSMSDGGIELDLSTSFELSIALACSGQSGAALGIFFAALGLERGSLARKMNTAQDMQSWAAVTARVEERVRRMGGLGKGEDAGQGTGGGEVRQVGVGADRADEGHVGMGEVRGVVRRLFRVWIREDGTRVGLGGE